MLNWSFSHHHSTWICHHTRTWLKLIIKYHFLHPEPILQPMECTYGIVVHVIWIGQIFLVVSIVASPSNGHLIQGFRDQNNLRNTCWDKKNVVYEYQLACKLPSTWAFPPTFFLTWQQLWASIFKAWYSAVFLTVCRQRPKCSFQIHSSAHCVIYVWEIWKQYAAIRNPCN